MRATSAVKEPSEGLNLRQSPKINSSTNKVGEHVDMGLQPRKANTNVTVGWEGSGGTSELRQRAGVKSNDVRSLRLRLLQVSLHHSYRRALSIKLLVKAVGDVISFLGPLDSQVPRSPHFGGILPKDGRLRLDLLLLLLKTVNSNFQSIPLLPQSLNLLSGRRKVLNFLRAFSDSRVSFSLFKASMASLRLITSREHRSFKAAAICDPDQNNKKSEPLNEKRPKENETKS